MADPKVTVSEETQSVGGTCPHCGKEININVPIITKEVPMNVTSPLQLAPRLCKKGLRPCANIFVYKVTSNMIAEYVTAVMRQFSPNARVILVPRFIERKQKSDEVMPHISYATVRIAISEDILSRKDDAGWFGRIGDSRNNISYINSNVGRLIEAWGYKREDIKSWEKSYKKMEKLETRLGMTETFFNELRKYAVPAVVQSDNTKWVMVEVAPENILRDMFREEGSREPSGKMIIQDVYQLSKDVVEYVIYEYPKEMDMKEDPRVRQIMMGGK